MSKFLIYNTILNGFIIIMGIFKTYTENEYIRYAIEKRKDTKRF